jgi:hypothetical protein
MYRKLGGKGASKELQQSPGEPPLANPLLNAREELLIGKARERRSLAKTQLLTPSCVDPYASHDCAEYCMHVDDNCSSRGATP